MKLRALGLAAAALLASACTTMAAEARASAAASRCRPAEPAGPAAGTPSARLRQLFHDSDEANLRRNPLSAMFRGDFRYADRLGDVLTDAYFAAERSAAEEDLATLAAIDRNALNPTDRLAYDVFKFQREDDLLDFQPRHAGADRGAAGQPFQRLPHLLPGVRVGRSAAPFRTSRITRTI